MAELLQFNGQAINLCFGERLNVFDLLQKLNVCRPMQVDAQIVLCLLLKLNLVIPKKVLHLVAFM